ncbi:hypothetical protein ACFSL6_11080 [Paenibacillus thailandensis]|uniref:hypothetical protein n=1 Tax=Paenibacillus thailandensis TaxID=393250 RepID=UPI00363CEE60
MSRPLRPWKEVSQLIGSSDNKSVARKWSEASVTLVKNEGGLLPLRRSARTLVLWPDIVPVFRCGRDAFRRRNVIRIFVGASFGRNGAFDVRRRSAEGLERFEQIVVVTYDAAKHETERRVAQQAINWPETVR